MFDIGFWEIAVIVVVALLVVGPKEFPTLVRNIGVWVGKTRRFVATVKNDFEAEVNKADELKRMLDKEAQIAEAHEQPDPGKPTVPVARPAPQQPGTEPPSSGPGTDARPPEPAQNSSDDATHR
jgi:sec-independent protein translocase protein TatB